VRGLAQVAAVLVVFLAVACQSDGDRDYSVGEVKAAFADVGVPLETVVDAPPGPFTTGGVLLSGDLGSSFIVSVHADRRYAKEAYETLRSQATSSSFDRLSRNVLVSGDGLSRAEQRTVMEALDHLR
jgi:hypothetical protein